MKNKYRKVFIFDASVDRIASEIKKYQNYSSKIFASDRKLESTNITYDKFKEFIFDNRDNLIFVNKDLERQNPGTRIFTLIKTYTLQDRI